jgi:hypothetical protein
MRLFSTDLMKCVWPRTKLVSPGFSTFTVTSCMLPSTSRFAHAGFQAETRAPSVQADVW